MLAYPSSIDLSTRTLRHLTGQLIARRLETGTRWRRLTAGRQALLALAHLRCGHTYAQLAAGFGIGIATVYRYIREAVDAPALTEAMKTASAKAFVFLDGILLPIDRIGADTPYYSGKHKRHGMNVQVRPRRGTVGHHRPRPPPRRPASAPGRPARRPPQDHQHRPRHTAAPRTVLRRRRR